MSPQTGRWIGWPACFTLVFVSAFFLSGTQPPPLELDPSWHTALEYAAAHHWQFGTQIVFTFGPLGFLSARTSLGHLVGARVAFGFFWSALVALAATGLARRLTGWVRYALLAWLVVFTLSEGIDQTGFFVMACGATLLLIDNPRQRWQAPVYVSAFIILSFIKSTFLTAAIGSLVIVAVCWIWQRKILNAIVLLLATPAGSVACWTALGQSASHLAPWFRHAMELQSGYSAAMNLAPKNPVLCAALGALAAFVGAFALTVMRAREGIPAWGILITTAQYVFLAWKEGFTRSGDWHTFVFLWFLPLGVGFLFLGDLWSSSKPSYVWVLKINFLASILLCLVAANFQIPGFAWQQVAAWPSRVAHHAKTIVATLGGRADDAYAGCRDAKNDGMLQLERARDVIGNESVDVMNYLSLAAIINGMNYRPRPVFQGFVAYTPALQDLNAAYFRSEGRPRYVMLRQQATDGRFPTLEDSAALNYVLNNYVPVARDGSFLILQQRSAETPVFQLVHEEALHFDEKVDLRPWEQGPLFMSVDINPALMGRAAALLYQQQPLYMIVSTGHGQERYRLVPSMAEKPFLVNPVLNSNFDVTMFYASRPREPVKDVTFERPRHGAFEFRDHLTVRLYTCLGFPRAARSIPPERMLADLQGLAFWPEPKLVESAAPARPTILHGTPALVGRAPSKIVVEIPEKAVAFSGYFGIPEETYAGGGTAPGVTISIEVQDRAGQSRQALGRVLQPSSRADDRGRIAFRILIESTRERSITLTTRPAPFASGEGGWSIWSQCRFEE